MDLSDDAPASSMLPPNAVQPRETRRYTKEEWGVQRPIIVQKYHTKGTTLRMIVDYLSDERGFPATERQLKRKVADWQLDKNIKGHEMRSIVRKEARLKLKGKTAAFRVRGQPVPQQKIERWERRSGTSQASLITQALASSPCPTTPTLSVVSYDTISERGSLSPFVPPRMLDTSQGHNILTIYPADTPEDRAVPLNDYEGYFDLENLGGSPPSGVLTNIDTESPFAGESPAPFTAPPSPAPSWMETSPRDSPPKSSDPLMGQRAREPTDRLVMPSNSTALLQPISRHVPADSEIIALPSRTRYRQREENETRRRLHELLHQYGPQHPATIDTLFRLGGILYGQGRFRAAEVAFREVLARCQKTFGATHQKTIEANAQLLRILLLQGRPAVQLSRECYAVASSSLYPTHRTLLISKMLLADALRFTGESIESEALYRDVLQLTSSTFAPDDVLVLDCLSYFALLLEELGNFDEMERALRVVLLASSLTVVTEEVSILRVRYTLSRCMYRQEKYLESEAESTQVLMAQTKLLGQDHPETLITQELLIKVLIAENRYLEGEKIAKDVIERLVRVLGPNHHVTLMAESSLVQILFKQSQYSEAEILLTKWMARAVNDLGSSYIIESFMVIGRIYRAQGRVEDCRVVSQRAVDHAITLRGEDSPITKACIREFTMFLADVGQMDAEEMVLKRA